MECPPASSEARAKGPRSDPFQICEPCVNLEKRRLLHVLILIFRAKINTPFGTQLCRPFLLTYTQFIYSNRDVFIAIAQSSSLLHSTIAR
jgi:hypothetical protein